MGFTWTIVTLVIALGLTWRYLGSYMAAVFDGRVHFLGWAERPVYRLLGTEPEQEQNWKRYAGVDDHLLGHRHGRHLPAHPASRGPCPSIPSTSARWARHSASTPPPRS